MISNPPIKQFVTPSSNTSRAPAQSIDESENPYGYFGMENTTPPISNSIHSSPFQSTPRNGLYPQISPQHSNIQTTGSPQIFTFQQPQQQQNFATEDNYGYFNHDALPIPNEIQRLVSHDQILSITSTDGSQVDQPLCLRSASDPIAKSTGDLSLPPMKLHQTQSYRILSTNGNQPFPQINRSELSCLLNESSHCGREGKHEEALKITTLVDQEIRVYIENVKRLQESKTCETNSTDKRSERVFSTECGMVNILFLLLF